MIEDDAVVAIRGAVLGDHERTHAERILFADAVVDVAGIGGFDCHVVVGQSHSENVYPPLLM
jgi:hypothetical protein